MKTKRSNVTLITTLWRVIYHASASTQLAESMYQIYRFTRRTGPKLKSYVTDHTPFWGMVCHSKMTQNFW